MESVKRRKPTSQTNAIKITIPKAVRGTMPAALFVAFACGEAVKIVCPRN
jgi:hypothetical protein